MIDELTNDQIARVFALYPNARVINPNHPHSFRSYNNTMCNWYDASEHNKSTPGFWDDRRLMLYDLKKIKPFDLQMLCKCACPELYGNYRYHHWYIKLDPKNDGQDWVAVELYNNRATSHFQVDLINGEIKTWDNDGQLDLYAINNYYHQWYFVHSYAMPIYFNEVSKLNGKNPVELKIALYAN